MLSERWGICNAASPLAAHRLILPATPCFCCAHTCSAEYYARRPASLDFNAALKALVKAKPERKGEKRKIVSILRCCLIL